MEDEVKSWLYAIGEAIREIEYFIPNPRVYDVFEKDIKTFRAVERNIEIIGEATNRILSKMPDIKITDSRKIVDTRKRVAHGYDSISKEVLWAIVINDLPKLKKEVAELLSEKNNSRLNHSHIPASYVQKQPKETSHENEFLFNPSFSH